MYPQTLLLVCMATSASCTPLLTDGPRLIDAVTNERVRLRCVNWYGAHQEPMVPGGLEVTSTDAIADLIVSRVGANCVRLPLSDKTVLRNPIVDPAFAPAYPNATALEVLDAVIRSLTSRGLMVILNSHTTQPGWIGSNETQQGLWHGHGLRTVDWAQALATLAARYANNPLVVGFDLRNEIHNQEGITITWGESNDADSDWLAAATLADRAITHANPDALIIVSGLCRSYDLRKMVHKPGPKAALNRRKLVYTTHVYTFSWWWTYMEPYPVPEVALVLFLSSLIALAVAFRCRDISRYDALSQYDSEDTESKPATKKTTTPCPTMDEKTVLAFAGAFTPFACVWIAIACIKAEFAYSTGCDTIAAETEPWITAGAIVLVPSMMALALCCITKGNGHMLLIGFLFWTCLACLAVCILCCVAPTYWMVQEELRRWCLDERTIPVWVGEFGAPVDSDSSAWRHLTRMLRDNDLDFAYWALNGRKWNKAGWQPESFGLLDESYARIQNESFTQRVFEPKKNS